MHIKEIREIAAEQLANHGWTPWTGPNDYVVATKPVQTAAGERSVTAWLIPGDEYTHAIMKAEYTSEGRNALATEWHPISDAANRDQICAIVDKYVADVEQVIAGTYAVRLLSK